MLREDFLYARTLHQVDARGGGEGSGNGGENGNENVQDFTPKGLVFHRLLMF